MDRNMLREREEPGTFLLPSRARALQVARGTIATGPLLITGEAGVGKTWLAGRIAEASRMECGLRWVAIDLTPTTGPLELLRCIGRALGIEHPAAPAELRIALADLLAESSEDGQRWGLIVDEAHLASETLLEEIRVLSNRLVQPDGFESLMLVGQTVLARRLGGWALGPLRSRLAGHVHLRPLDAEEAVSFLRRIAPEKVRTLGVTRLEREHREASGNPRRLLIAASAWPVTVETERRVMEPVEPAPSLSLSRERQAPPILEDRPPLDVGEGMIEVGWEADSAEPEPEREPQPELEPETIPPVGTRPQAPRPTGMEVVDDRYAALQAWDEWTRNQGRVGPGSEAEPIPAGDHSDGPSDEAESAPDQAAGPWHRTEGSSTVWAEGEQGFAPYSQLFSRLRQTRDREA